MLIASTTCKKTNGKMNVAINHTKLIQNLKVLSTIQISLTPKILLSSNVWRPDKNISILIPLHLSLRVLCDVACKLAKILLKVEIKSSELSLSLCLRVESRMLGQ